MNEKVENGEDWQEFCAKNLSSLALIFLNRTHREAAVIKIYEDFFAQQVFLTFQSLCLPVTTRKR